VFLHNFCRKFVSGFLPLPTFNFIEAPPLEGRPEAPRVEGKLASRNNLEQLINSADAGVLAPKPDRQDLLLTKLEIYQFFDHVKSYIRSKGHKQFLDSLMNFSNKFRIGRHLRHMRPARDSRYELRTLQDRIFTISKVDEPDSESGQLFGFN
jgi:hypothetical protein